jgi:hypothetical protein
VAKFVNSKIFEMTKDTGIVCGEFDAPGAVTVIVAEYVPVASPEVFAETVIVEGALPEPAEMVNQLALEEAVQFMDDPPPVFVIDIVWLEGLVPPTEAAKLKLEGLTLSDGGSDPRELYITSTQ